MGLFSKKKDKVSTSPVTGSSALSGLAFKGAKQNAAAPPGSSSRPSWNTSLTPDPKGSAPTSVNPSRQGIALLDARVALAPPKELGLLLVSIGTKNLRPVLVPSVLKIVGSTLKQRGSSGVMGDRSIAESHFKAALDAVKAPEEVAANLNPGLDLYWIDENKYALGAPMQEGVWRALIDGVDDSPAESGKNAIERRAGLPPEGLKQISDRLTISHEIVVVCRNTHGPHLFFTSDDVLEASCAKDLIGGDLASNIFDMSRGGSLGFRSSSDADAMVSRLFAQGKQAQSGIPVPNHTPQNVPSNGLAASAGTSLSPAREWKRPGGDQVNDPYDIDPMSPA